MQHRRGSLFPRHALPRGDHGGQAQHQAAGLRLRRRSGCRRQRPRGALPGDDRGGRVAGAPCPVLHQGRPRLPGIAGAARDGGLHRAGCAGRSAVLAPRLDFVPQSADLSAARGAGEGHLAVPFRAARGRHPAARQLGDGRQCRRPLRGDLEAGAALPAHRPQPAGRARFFDGAPAMRRGSPHASATDHSAHRARPRSPTSASSWCWRPMRRPRS